MTRQLKCSSIALSFLLLATFPCLAVGDKPSSPTAQNQFWGNWALKMPDGAAGWLSLSLSESKPKGELWTVGGGRKLSEIFIEDDTLQFVRQVRVGKPEYEGGPPAGPRIACRYSAKVRGDVLQLVMHHPRADGKIEKRPFTGKRLPPLPPKPDLSKVKFGEPIRLFNGRNLEGWKLTNPKQINGWKAIDGELANTTPKLDFAPYSRYGNLRTKQEFLDFNLKIEFKVPPGGNSGIYLRGVYEAQVLDRDSKMQGIQGVGAIFGRIKPTENAGKPGAEWNTYDITLVDRHVTVILNGKTIIENQPLVGCTNGALHADDTLPGPLYLQGDHTAVRYRNIVLRPVLKEQRKSHSKIGVMETAFGKRGDVTSFEEAKAAGYSAIQMHSGQPAGISKKPIDQSLGLEIGRDPKILQSWKVASEKHGVEIVSLSAGSLNKCQIWDRDREVAMRIAKQTIDACHTLDVPVMLFPFFGPSNFQTSDDALNGVAEFLQELLPYARKKRVIIGIEAPVTTVRVLELLKQLNYPANVKIYYDTGNLFAKEDIYETIRKHGKKHFCEVHIKPAGNAVIGRGQIDLEKLAQALDAAEYDKWLVYEAGRKGREPIANRLGIEEIHSLRNRSK